MTGEGMLVVGMVLLALVVICSAIGAIALVLVL